MIYNLKQLNKELIKETQQLSEKFIGIKGKLKKDGKKYYIYGYNLQIMLDCRKINERNIRNLKGYDYFFGFVNDLNDLGRQHLSKGAHKANFEDVCFNPFLHEGLPGFLGRRNSNIKKTSGAKARIADCLKSNKIAKIAVICSKNSRVYPDLLTGINFHRESKQLESKFCFKHHYVEYKQQKGENNSKDNKELINKFIKALKMVDRKHDIVAIIRGGSDRNMTCILDAPEIHAALLTMETPTICGVGHTNEHKEFKKYCDHADETPSLLGVTLGSWAEEFCP